MSTLVGELTSSNEHQLRMKEIEYLEVAKRSTDMYSSQLTDGKIMTFIIIIFLLIFFLIFFPYFFVLMLNFFFIYVFLYVNFYPNFLSEFPLS